MSKPREFAHLIRNKFGSADNINHIRAVEHTPSLSAPDDALVTSPATVSTLSAGNSNSLPGHGTTSQVGHCFVREIFSSLCFSTNFFHLFYFSRQLANLRSFLLLVRVRAVGNTLQKKDQNVAVQ